MKQMVGKIVELPDEAHLYLGDWGWAAQGTMDLGPQKRVTIPAGHAVSRSCPCAPTANLESDVAPKILWEHRSLAPVVP